MWHDLSIWGAEHQASYLPHPHFHGFQSKLREGGREGQLLRSPHRLALLEALTFARKAAFLMAPTISPPFGCTLATCIHMRSQVWLSMGKPLLFT